MAKATTKKHRKARDADHDPLLDTSPEAKEKATNRRLVQYLERVERLEEEKKGISDDIKDVYNEMKAVGYDAKIARQVVRLRKMPPNDRREMETLLDLYKAEAGLD